MKYNLSKPCIGNCCYSVVREKTDNMNIFDNSYENLEKKSAGSVDRIITFTPLHTP